MRVLSKIVAAVASGFSFVERFADEITGVLTCFDRVIFKGYLPFTDQRGIENFVDFGLRMRRVDFLNFAHAQAEKLVEYAQKYCQVSGAPYLYLQGKQRKEAIIDRLLRQRPISQGLVAVLCTMECCQSFRLVCAAKRPSLVPSRRQQRVLYFYYLDPAFGLLHVRLQTWFPLTVQVYLNGHSWLARQLAKAGLRFVQHDNAFTYLGNAAAAQGIADRFVGLSWPRILDQLVAKFNPLMREHWFDGRSYYWVIDQAEVATDVIFASRHKLAAIYPMLLATANRFSPKDILSYLGRRLHHRFDGEVVTDCKTDRLPGARIKHRMKDNWLKMYDKFSQVLRIETVINNPHEFRVLKRCHCRGVEILAYRPMNKGVSNLRHYYQHALAANGRYLEALAAVDTPRAAYKHVQLLSARKVTSGRSYAGFSPADADNVRLFRALLDGDHLLRGFRNRDIRRRLYRSSTTAPEGRRQTAAIGRIFRRLHVRALIAHIPRTRRWRVTNIGQRILQLAVHLYDHGIPNYSLAA